MGRCWDCEWEVVLVDVMLFRVEHRVMNLMQRSAHMEPIISV